MGSKWKPITRARKAKERDRLVERLEGFRDRNNLSIKELIFVLSPTISEPTYRDLRSKKTLPTPKSLKLLKQAIKSADSMEEDGHVVKRDNRILRIQKFAPFEEPAEPPEPPKIVSAQAKAEASALKCKAKCATCGATFELEAGANVSGNLPPCPCGGKFKLVLGKNGS